MEIIFVMAKPENSLSSTSLKNLDNTERVSRIYEGVEAQAKRKGLISYKYS